MEISVLPLQQELLQIICLPAKSSLSQEPEVKNTYHHYPKHEDLFVFKKYLIVMINDLCDFIAEEKLLNCLQAGTEKIKLLLAIPKLCSWIVTKRNPQFKLILGPECTEALHQLLDAQLVKMCTN